MAIKYTEEQLNTIDKSLLVQMFLNQQEQLETLTIQVRSLNEKMQLMMEQLVLSNSVFCNHFLYKVAKSFCRSLHLHFVGNCKGTCQAFRPDRNALQTLFNCYSTRYGNGSSEFSSSCACSLKYWKSSSSFW